MQTKKSDEFVKHALKLQRAKFAVVGSGTTWTFYDGADLAKAAASAGQTLVKASFQRKTDSLAVVVVGGADEVRLLKTKVFAAQLGKNPKSFTFKTVSPDEGSALDQLLAEIDGPLVEQIGQLASPAREALVTLLNEARQSAVEGELGPARAKLQELDNRLATKGDSAEQAAERKKLAAQLQGVLSEQLSQLPNARRESLRPVFNQALQLASAGDLKLANDKVAELKQALQGGGLPVRPMSTPSKSTPTAVRPSTIGQRPASVGAAALGDESQALLTDIGHHLKVLRAEWPEAAAQIEPDLAACLKDPQAARQLEKLKALQAKAAELAEDHRTLGGLAKSRSAAPVKDAADLQRELIDLVDSLTGSTVPSARKAGEAVFAKLKECLNERDATRRLQHLNALRNQAAQMKVAADVQAKRPADSLLGEAKSLHAEIARHLKELRAGWPQAAAEVEPKLAECLQDADAARQLQVLRKLRDEAAQLVQDHQTLDDIKPAHTAAPKNASQVMEEIQDIVQVLMASQNADAQKAAALFRAKLPECLDEATPALVLHKLTALRSQALQLKTATEVHTKLREDKQRAVLQMQEDRDDIKQLLAELSFPPVAPQARQLREKFKKACDTVVATRAGPDALMAIASLRAEVNALPEVKQLRSESAKQARLAATQVKLTPPDKLKDLPAQQRIKLLLALRRGSGVKDKACQEAMVKLHKAMPLEKDFQNKDDVMREKVLAGLKENLREARRNWKNLDDKKEKVEALQMALSIQLEAMRAEWGVDVPTPTLVTFEEGPSGKKDPQTGEDLFRLGGFAPGNGSIEINLKAPAFQDFDKTLDTLIHENTHNFQQALVDALEAGQIDPQKEPEKYNQAVLFQLNMPPLGYLDEKTDGYEEQSTERHAWLAGRQARRLFELEDTKSEVAKLLARVEQMSQELPSTAPRTTRDELEHIRHELEATLKSDDAEHIGTAFSAAMKRFMAVLQTFV